jgi:hypothetical protein
MQKKLAELCERQLQSILDETHCAFDKIVDSATLSFNLSNELRSTAPAVCKDQKNVKSGVENISVEMQKLLVCLQFHDELSQRVQHVIELCKLLTESVAQSGQYSDETDPVLLERVADLFSVSAEFDALEKVFPEYRHKNAGVAIELF